MRCMCVCVPLEVSTPACNHSYHALRCVKLFQVRTNCALCTMLTHQLFVKYLVHLTTALAFYSIYFLNIAHNFRIEREIVICSKWLQFFAPHNSFKIFRYLAEVCSEKFQRRHAEQPSELEFIASSSDNFDRRNWEWIERKAFEKFRILKNCRN